MPRLMLTSVWVKHGQDVIRMQLTRITATASFRRVRKRQYYVSPNAIQTLGQPAIFAGIYLSCLQAEHTLTHCGTLYLYTNILMHYIYIL